MATILVALKTNLVIRLVIVAVVMDTLFGAGRAVKHHSFNSSVGIDGAIRKISMLVSLMFLAVVDTMIHINLIGFLPEQVRSFLPESLSVIGLADFFGLLYLAYEVVSILKNMYLCGLPVKRLWKRVDSFLEKYTDELPDGKEEDLVEKQNELKEAK